MLASLTHFFKREKKKNLKKKEKRKPYNKAGNAGLSRFLQKKTLPEQTLIFIYIIL